MKRLALALALALTLLVAQPAAAYFVTCGEFRAVFLVGDDETMNILGGHVFGVSDMLATLLCFGGDRRCNCLSNMTNRPGDYGTAVANAIVDCPANANAVGQIFNAALQVCR
jgi:hypothetical protein